MMERCMAEWCLEKFREQLADDPRWKRYCSAWSDARPKDLIVPFLDQHVIPFFVSRTTGGAR